MSEDKVEQAKRVRSESLYPPRSLMDSLRIATAIKDYGAGNPYDRLDLAKALNTVPSARIFREQITASSQFGLTHGSYVAQRISLAPLGRSIVYPENTEQRKSCLKEALFKIPFYKKFFEDYDNNKLPSAEFLEGTLNRNYGIPVSDANECYKLLLKNAEELGILDDLGGSKYVHLNKLGETAIAKAEIPTTVTEATPQSADEKPKVSVPSVPSVNLPVTGKEGLTVNVTINFELPITKEAEVYDKIFQSLKRNILSQDSKAS